MKHQKPVFLIALIALIGFFSTVTLAQERAMLIEKLYKDSGLEPMVNALPISIAQGIEGQKSAISQGQDLPDKFWQLLLERISEDFSAENIKRVMLDDLDNGLTDQEIKANLDWSQTQLGKKAKQLSESVYSDEGVAKLNQCMLKPGLNPPDENRVEQVEALNELLKATELTMEMVKITQIASATAANLSLPKHLQMPTQQINEQINGLVDPMHEQMRSLTLTSYYCIFESFSNEEMDDYLVELEKPHSQSFYQAIVKGLKQSFYNGTFNFGESVVEISKQLADFREL